MGTGLTLDDGVVCDETLFTGAEGVYAAGDVACWHNPVFDRPMRLEHWTSAAEQGALAARNALNPGAAKAYATVPYFWSDQYDTRIQFVGVPDAEEIAVTDGDMERDHQCVALYRAGDRLVGALAVNRPTEIMKYRRLVARGASWEEGLAFARSRSDSRQTADV